MRCHPACSPLTEAFVPQIQDHATKQLIECSDTCSLYSLCAASHAYAKTLSRPAQQPLPCASSQPSQCCLQPPAAAATAALPTSSFFGPELCALLLLLPPADCTLLLPVAPFAPVPAAAAAGVEGLVGSAPSYLQPLCTTGSRRLVSMPRLFASCFMWSMSDWGGSGLRWNSHRPAGWMR